MEPLAWYIAGPLIGLTVPLLLILSGKQLGISSSLRAVGALTVPKLSYFNYAYKKDSWQLYFVVGIVLASLILFQISVLGIPASKEGDIATTVYSVDYLHVFFFGSVLVGFGARYANGCTAGHCIMGNAQFAPSSVITTISFFIGGLLATHLITPYLFEI